MTNRSTKKTILILIDFFHIGGVCTIADAYVRFLRKHNCNVIVLGMEGDAQRYPTYFNNFFTDAVIYKIPNLNWDTIHDSLINKIKFNIYLVQQFVSYTKKILRTNNIDCIHFNLTWSALSILLFIPSVYKLKRITTFYNDLELEYQANQSNQFLFKKIKNKIKSTLLYLSQLIVFALSTDIIALSSYSIQLLKRYHIPKKKIWTIPGFLPNNFHTSVQVKKKSVFEIINISRFEKRKGHILLLTALKKILIDGYKAHLTLSGPLGGDIQPILNTYEHLALSTHMSILHTVTGKDKRKLLQSGNVFVIPSTSLETFGMTIIEALSQGIPVIGTPSGAIPEILKHVDTRLITKSISSESIKNRIEWLINLDPAERAKLQRQCKKVVSLYYSEQSVKHDLMKLYEITE